MIHVFNGLSGIVRSVGWNGFEVGPATYLGSVAEGYARSLPILWAISYVPTSDVLHICYS